MKALDWIYPLGSFYNWELCDYLSHNVLRFFESNITLDALRYISWLLMVYLGLVLTLTSSFSIHNPNQVFLRGVWVYLIGLLNTKSSWLMLRTAYIEIGCIANIVKWYNTDIYSDNSKKCRCMIFHYRLIKIIKNHGTISGSSSGDKNE